jgi:hypothetical protein
MTKLTKTDRKAIIEKWLNGESDDEYSVTPLKEDGKYRYRVSKRKQNDEKVWMLEQGTQGQ